MTPWLLLSVLVALANLFAFILVRGRWGSLVPFLALASLIGTMAYLMITAIFQTIKNLGA